MKRFNDKCDSQFAAAIRRQHPAVSKDRSLLIQVDVGILDVPESSDTAFIFCKDKAH